LQSAIQPDLSFLRTVLDVVGDAVNVVNSEWRYTYVNERTLVLTGKTREEIIGQVLWEAFPELLGSATEQALRRAARDRAAVTWEDYYAPLDRWFEGTAFPVQDGLAAVTRDITERRRAEVMLRDAVQTQRALIDASPLPIAVIAGSGMVTVWNAAAERVFGWSAEEVIGRPLPFIPESKRAEHALMRQRDLSGTGFSEREIERVRKDGSPIVLSVSTAPVKDRNGTVAGIISIYQDISARKASEAALRLNGRIIESMTEGVSVATETGIITYTNAAEDRMFGYAPGELIGKHVTVQNAYPPGENEARVQEVIRELQACGHWSGEWHNRRKDGSEFFTQARITALQQDGRKYFVCVQEDVTEKRRAHAQLIESETRLRLALEAAQLGVWEWDIADHRVVWSDRVYEIHGLEPGSLTGRPEEIGALFYSEDRDRVTQAVLDALARKSGYEIEFRIVRPDGSIRWICTIGNVVTNEAGEPVRMLGTTRDTTDEHLAADQIRANEERLDLAARAGHFGTFDWDIATGRVIWSDQQERLFGLESGAFEGGIDDWRRRLHPDDAAGVWARLEQAMQARDVEVALSHRINLPDGSVRSIEGAGRFLYDRDGRAVRMVGVNVDVTERNAAEQALRDSEERQRLAADAGKVGLWDWDIRSDSVVWSDRVYEFHGVAPGTFGGAVRDFAALVHPEDQKRVGDAIAAALQDRLPYELEFRVLRPDGETRWLTTSARVVYGDDGTPIRMLGATLDVTERHDSEERLRRSNEELEEFAFVASHDLQEPLRMINAYTELLLRRLHVKDDSEVQEYRRYIEQGVARMQELIHDLLAYSRVIHAERESRGTADLQQALEKALRTLESRFLETGATIVGDRLPLVRGEESQFEQVFQNLLGNSLKYCHPDRTPEIRVTVSQTEHECTITIGDNGIGFDQKYSERIFKLFKRLHKDEYPGTGLGLAICKRIVERHGGRIWAEGVRDQGCRFHFTVPLAGD
jgi:PAS domain S-box-containing protein